MNVTSRISSLPSLTFSVAPTTSWWMLSISASCHQEWDGKRLSATYLQNMRQCFSNWEKKTKGSQLTCCRTFSAKISCSREISTTFPSICLPHTKTMMQHFQTIKLCLFEPVAWYYRVRSGHFQTWDHFASWNKFLNDFLNTNNFPCNTNIFVIFLSGGDAVSRPCLDFINNSVNRV